MQSPRSKQFFFFFFSMKTFDKSPPGQEEVGGWGGLQGLWGAGWIGRCLRPCHEMKST